MKLTILFGSSLENVGRLKPALTLFGLACLMIGIAGAEPATDLFAPAAKGPKNTVVATIPCGSNPYDIVVSPDNKTVYVASRGSNTVVVINTATNTVTASIPVGSVPNGIAITPDGTKVYVTNFSGDSVSVIDTATNLVSATVTLQAQEPAYVTVSPDGTSVYVATGGYLDEGVVSVIDTATNAVTSISTKKNDIGVQVVFNLAGTKAYLSGFGASNAQPDNLFELSPSEEKVTRTITPRTQGYVTLAMNPNGKSLYMSEAKQVSVFDLAENKVVKKILLPSTVESILRGAVTPNGKYLYLPAGFTETVVMVDLVTNRYVESFQAGSEPTAVAIAPNGNYAYVADGSEDASAVTVVDISEQ